MATWEEYDKEFFKKPGQVEPAQTAAPTPGKTPAAPAVPVTPAAPPSWEEYDKTFFKKPEAPGAPKPGALPPVPDPAAPYGGPEKAPKAAGALSRPSTFAKPGPWETTLTPDEEERFWSWAKENKVPFDRNDPKSMQDYDMRGFWKGLMEGDPHATSGVDPFDGRMHFSDYWKTPTHETFSNESKYAMQDAPHWKENRYLVDKDDKVLFDAAAQKPWQNISPTGARPLHEEVWDKLQEFDRSMFDALPEPIKATVETAGAAAANFDYGALATLNGVARILEKTINYPGHVLSTGDWSWDKSPTGALSWLTGKTMETVAPKEVREKGNAVVNWIAELLGGLAPYMLTQSYVLEPLLGMTGLGVTAGGLGGYCGGASGRDSWGKRTGRAGV